MENHVALPSPTLHKRRGSYHRKRMSTGRLSSDSIPSLPEYSSNSSPWRPTSDATLASIWDTDGADGTDGVDSDNDELAPPRYSAPPRSANASTSMDEDADHEGDDKRAFASKKRQARHRRSYSFTTANSTDSYLDALLERSVKALEISNSLLQTSITSQTGLPSVSECDPFIDQSVETHAPTLSLRIGESNLQDSRLDEMFRGIMGAEEVGSQSLPVDSGKYMEKLRIDHESRPRRRHNHTSVSQLQLATTDEVHFATVPRCLTQYVSVNANADETTESISSSQILLPSTLGLRGTSRVTTFNQSPPPSAGIQTPALPVLNDRPAEPSTPAITLLSNIVARNVSSRSSSPAPSPSIRSPQHSASNSWSSGVWKNKPPPQNATAASEDERSSRSLFRNPATAAGEFLAQAKTHLLSANLLSPPQSPTTVKTTQGLRRSRSMTPSLDRSKPTTSRPPPLKLAALEPESPPRPETETRSDGVSDVGAKQPVNAFRTMESLRRILEDSAPLSEVAAGKRPAIGERPLVPRRAPAFYPLTPQRTTVADLTTTVHSSPPSMPGTSKSTNFTLPSTSTGRILVTIPDPAALTEAIYESMPSPSGSSNNKMPSSLRIVSGSSTPSASGRSTPRVTFSPLPPKHHASPILHTHRKSRADKTGKQSDPGDATLASKPGWFASWWDLSSHLKGDTRERVNMVREERGGARPGSFDM